MLARESIEKYIQLFANLRTDKSASRWPDRVRNRASQKPILLLSVLDLFELNKIDSNFIEITEDLLDPPRLVVEAEDDLVDLAVVVVAALCARGDGLVERGSVRPSGSRCRRPDQ